MLTCDDANDTDVETAPSDREATRERVSGVTLCVEWLSQRQADEIQAGRPFRDAMDWIMWSESRKGESSGAALRVQIRSGRQTRDCYYTQTRQYHITGDVKEVGDNLNGDLVLRADGQWGWEDVFFLGDCGNPAYIMDINRASQLGQALARNAIDDSATVPQVKNSPRQSKPETPQEHPQGSQSTSPAWPSDAGGSSPNSSLDSWCDVENFWAQLQLSPAEKRILQQYRRNWRILFGQEKYHPRPAQEYDLERYLIYDN